MTQLKVSQIKNKLRSMFESHLNLSDISTTDPKRDEKILSRCLAAHAIYLECGCSEIDAGKAVWDGADDNGIDAAYFDTAGSRVVFAQSKFIHKGSGEPDAVDIGAFTKGVKDVIEQEITEFHPRIHNQLSILFQHLNNPGTSVHLVVVSTGASKLAKHGMAYIKGLLKELNGNDPDPIATHQIIGLKEVYGGLATSSNTKGLTLDAQLLEWSHVSTPFRAYFGMIDGLQLKQWWKDHGKKVVSGNIRHALGVTDVNTKIRNTAVNEPENFWYFNNGITLVADEAAKAPGGAASRAAGNFEFRGASIVNGAQTVSTLGKITDDDQLGKIRVPFRAILLKETPDGFGQEVTRSNNLQNRIEPRDFVAQDPEQERLRAEMSIENVDYLYVRSEDTVISPSSCDLIEVTTALACSAKDPNLAVQVKTGVSRFYADLTKAPYKTIFNPSVSGARSFNVTLILREIDLWIDATKAGMPKKGGPGWGVLVHGNRILAAAVFCQIKEEVLTQTITSFRAAQPSLNIAAMCSTVQGKMVTAIALHYPARVLAVLFKNPTMSKHIYDLSK